ncbi:MAG: ribonuclease Y [Magnetococcus sp. WYHC-3]
MEIVLLIVGVVLGAAGPFYLMRNQRQEMTRQLEREGQRVQERVAEVERKAAEVERKAAEARQEWQLRMDSERARVRDEVNEELAGRSREIVELQKKLDKKEEQLDRKFDQLDGRERELERQRGDVDRARRDLEGDRERVRTQLQAATERLEQVAGMTGEQALAELKEGLMEQARREAARSLKMVEEETRETASKKAQEVIAGAIQRYAGEYVAENTVSVVGLPTDEMKGRIIGREGRNIRALEAATGCDLIIDDTPEAVVISCFDPVRRQIGKRTLEELVGDGRIHPARIEDVVKKATKAVQNEIREAGEQALFDLGLNGVHPDVVRLLGALKFRTSYTQNVLNHSIEVGFLAGMMAEELGLDAQLARRCGLLHDIGKAVDHEVQGSHAVIGGQLAKKYKEPALVVNAVWSHHFDIEPISVYGPLTNAADALSAARPGARRENVQTYIKRLENLERIATDFPGVDKAYAIQAGRELRVLVQYDKVNDEGSLLLAQEIAQRVENEMTYPGQIKVTVIREMRAMAVAQ